MEAMVPIRRQRLIAAKKYVSALVKTLASLSNANPPLFSFAGLLLNMFDPKLVHPSHHDNLEVAKNRPAEQFRSVGGAKEYSIWQKSSYLGSPLSADLPAYLFLGMAPKKLFNPKMPLHHHDNTNNQIGFDYQRKGTDNEKPNSFIN